MPVRVGEVSLSKGPAVNRGAAQTAALAVSMAVPRGRSWGLPAPHQVLHDSALSTTSY